MEKGFVIVVVVVIVVTVVIIAAAAFVLVLLGHVGFGAASRIRFSVFLITVVAVVASVVVVTVFVVASSIFRIGNLELQLEDFFLLLLDLRLGTFRPLVDRLKLPLRLLVLQSILRGILLRLRKLLLQCRVLFLSILLSLQCRKLHLLFGLRLRLLDFGLQEGILDRLFLDRDGLRLDLDSEFGELFLRRFEHGILHRLHALIEHGISTSCAAVRWIRSRWCSVGRRMVHVMAMRRRRRVVRVATVLRKVMGMMGIPTMSIRRSVACVARGWATARNGSGRIRRGAAWRRWIRRLVVVVGVRRITVRAPLHAVGWCVRRLRWWRRLLRQVHAGSSRIVVVWRLHLARNDLRTGLRCRAMVTVVVLRVPADRRCICRRRRGAVVGVGSDNFGGLDGRAAVGDRSGFRLLRIGVVMASMRTSAVAAIVPAPALP
mmetsp:Transcript_4146/g.11841  ORF Transcript_4146/g.11841 Transcript_4146/m.11841 type:complete len:432 (+) Transcript_4146:1347-2642(+)